MANWPLITTKIQLFTIFLKTAADSESKTCCNPHNRFVPVRVEAPLGILFRSSDIIANCFTTGCIQNIVNILNSGKWVIVATRNLALPGFTPLVYSIF